VKQICLYVPRAANPCVEVKKAFPEFAPPMASSVKEPFDDPDWIFETKPDAIERSQLLIQQSSAVVP